MTSVLASTVVPSPRASSRRASLRDSPRDLGVDLARGVALVSMFLAHTAPSAGPGNVLTLSEYLTFPLFALLVGVGAELGARAQGPLPHLVGSLVRGGALLVLGAALAQAGAQVVIVLAPLGVLTLLSWALVRLPSAAVAGVGLVAFLLAPWSLDATSDLRLRLVLDQQTGRAWWLDLVASTFYPQAVLLTCASVGVLAVRLLRPRDGVRVGTGTLTGSTAALLAAAGLLIAAHAAGRIELVPYRTARLEQFFVLLLAAGVFSLCLLVDRLLAGRTVLHQLLTPLALAGAMTLTIYSLHIGWLALWVRRIAPGQPDDTWLNVAALTVGALLFALAWHALALPAPWRRGPLEGALSWTTALLLETLAPHRSDAGGETAGEPARDGVGESLAEDGLIGPSDPSSRTA